MNHKHISQIAKYFFICILFITIYACNSHINEKLFEAENLMETKPDSSLHILQSIEGDYEDMSDEEKALFGLSLFIAKDKNDLELPPIELIDFSVNYYTQINDNDRLAYSYLYKSRIFKNKREYTDAIQNLLKGLDAAKKTKDDSILGRIYFDIGHIASFQEEWDKALDYFQKAITHFDKAGKTENIAKIYLVQGWLYKAINDYDSAIKSSRKALEITKDSAIMGDVLNNIGDFYFKEEKLDSAFYYLRKSLHYPYFDMNLSGRYYDMADAFCIIDEYDSAAYYAEKALSLPIDIYYEEECYRVLINVALAKDDKLALVENINKRRACEDSIKKIENQTNINVLEEVHNSNTEKKKAEDRHYWLIIAIITLVLTTLPVVLFLYIRNKSKQLKADKYKNKLEEQEVIVSDLSSELKRKQKLLISDLMSEIEQTRIKYADARKNSNFEEREKIDKTIYNDVLHIDDEAAFTDKMNMVLNNLPDKLRYDYSELNYKEIVWCCLFMLDFSTADIALLMDFKQSTQYKFKQRLSKKLSLNSSKELEQMLHDKVNI